MATQSIARESSAEAPLNTGHVFSSRGSISLRSRIVQGIKWFASDPRHYQISALGFLLTYGLIGLNFDLSGVNVAITIASVLLFQFLAEFFLVLTPEAKLSEARTAFSTFHFEPRSALISGLSLCLLLRTNDPAIAIIAAALAVWTKFLIRFRGKHLFNPTNIALVILLLLAPASMWVSPGQWGNAAFFAFLMMCLGSLVVTRARRADVTIAFLGFHALFLFSRSLYMEEPMSIPLHRMMNGAVILFAFFMISDPRTTPDSRIGRIIFAFITAAGAYYVTFKMFHTNGLLWSLACCSLLTPLIDVIFRGSKYEWRASPRNSQIGVRP